MIRAHRLLKEQFQAKKNRDGAYSLRAWARDLKVSPSFLSEILNGKKPIPPKMLSKFISSLDMDSMAEQVLHDAILSEQIRKLKINAPLSKKKSRIFGYVHLSKRSFNLLEPWYQVALLDLVSCQNFSPNKKWLANVLGISEYQAELAWQFLINQGYVVLNCGKYKKSHSKMSLGSGSSQIQIRRFHAQMLELAKRQLQNSNQDEWQNREITGITVACNPKQIKKARRRLNEALSEIAEILTTGSCSRVYQLNLQLFPLTQDTNLTLTSENTGSAESSNTVVGNKFGRLRQQ